MELNILNLPLKALFQILQEVPDRWNTSQTCDTFYFIVAEIERFELRLGRSFSRNPIESCRFFNHFDDYIESIMETQRSFDDLHLSSIMGYKEIETICKNFGRDVKTFAIQDVLVGFEDSKFAEILRCMPKLEKLSIKVSATMPKASEEQKPIELKQLKQIKMSLKFNVDFLNLIEPCGVEEFYLNGYDAATGLASFFEKQKFINKLQLPCAVNLDALSLTHFKFVSIPFFETHDWEWQMMLRSQEKLLVLDIDGRVTISDRLFNFFRQAFKSLEFLSINIGSLQPESIAQIGSFQYLQDLRVANVNKEHLDIIAHAGVERLTLSLLEPFVDLHQVGLNFPRLKMLNVKINDPDTQVKLVDFVHDMNNLEVFRICFPSRSSFSSIKQFHSVDDSAEIFGKLKVLHIVFDDDETQTTFEENEFMELLSALPNLVNLNLQMAINVDFDVFAQLKSNRKLQHISIDSFNCSKESIVDETFFSNLKTFVKDIKTAEFDIQSQDIAAQVIKGFKNIHGVEATSDGDDVVEIKKLTYEDYTVMNSYDYEKEISLKMFDFTGKSLA